jgi:uncharacterized protein YdaU (DUF1376 family)
MEEAIYLRLVNFYYDNEKPIPLKTHLVLRKLRIADESETVDLILDEFFNKTKNGWTHKHCDKLIAEYQKMAERNKKNAKLGGRPKNNDLAKPSGKQDGNELKPSGIPNQELRTKNYKLETNNKKQKAKSLDWSALQMSDSEIQEVKRLRKSAKADVTQRVIDQLSKQFDLSRARGFTTDDILNEWSIKGWRSYKDEWMKGKPVKKWTQQQEQSDYDPLEEIRNL